MRAPTELRCRTQQLVGPLVISPLTCLRDWAPSSGGCSQPTAAAASHQRRSVWGEAAPREEVLHRDSFYDTVVETWAAKVRKLVLPGMRASDCRALIGHYAMPMAVCVHRSDCPQCSCLPAHRQRALPSLHPLTAARAQAHAAAAAQLWTGCLVRPGVKGLAHAALACCSKHVVLSHRQLAGSMRVEKRQGGRQE